MNQFQEAILNYFYTKKQNVKQQSNDEKRYARKCNKDAKAWERLVNKQNMACTRAKKKFKKLDKEIHSM